MIIRDLKMVRELASQRLIAVSGYFDPIHIGHLELIEKAKALGGQVVIIVNNEEQAILKKGKEFMPLEERMVILNALTKVSFVVPSIDLDRSITNTLKNLKPDIFANGGDRNNGEIPEAQICRDNNIEIVDGLGDKIQSSSNLTKGQ